MGFVFIFLKNRTQQHQKTGFGRVSRRGSREKTHRRRSGWIELEQSPYRGRHPQNPDFGGKSRRSNAPSGSAPLPQMSNGMQRWCPYASLGNSLTSVFRIFFRRIPPPRSAIFRNTTISSVCWNPALPVSQGGNCWSRKTFLDLGKTLDFCPSTFHKLLLEDSSVIPQDSLKILVLRHFSSMRTLAREGS